MFFFVIFFVLPKKTTGKNKLKRNAGKRHSSVSIGHDTDQPTNQSFRVCKVNLATPKVAMNKQYSVEEYGQHVLGSAHERSKLSMPDTTEQQVELPPNGKQRTQAKTKTEKQKIVVTSKVLQRRVIQSQNMTSPRKAKASLGPRLQNKDSKHGKSAAQGSIPKGTSPSGKPNQPSCVGHLKGKCTKPS